MPGAASLGRVALALALLAASFTLGAQPLAPSAQLPEWAQRRWEALAAARKLQISTRINPFVWRGDFDGDGRQDLAILVRDVVSGKEGIAVVLRRRTAARVLGAGTSFGNGGDDFSWMDHWTVQDRGSRLHIDREKGVALEADGLVVAREGSGSGLIHFRNGKPTWRQRGD